MLKVIKLERADLYTAYKAFQIQARPLHST